MELKVSFWKAERTYGLQKRMCFWDNCVFDLPLAGSRAVKVWRLRASNLLGPVMGSKHIIYLGIPISAQSLNPVDT